MRKLTAAAVAAVFFTLFLVNSAIGATTVGQASVPGIPTLPHTLNFATSTSTYPSNVVPSNGVITSYNHIAEIVPDATLALAVVRPVGAGFNFVGASTPQTLSGGLFNTFKTRIAVQAGDRIGVLGDTSNLAAATQTSNSGDVFQGTSDPLTPGQPITGLTPYIGYKLDIEAVVEPDADNDGYGDETQDLCPFNASIQTACLAPTLTTSYAKSQKKSIALKVTSNETATLTISAKVKAGQKTYKLKSKTVSAATNVANSVTLKLSSKLKNAIKNAGKGSATVTITGKEPSGKTTTKNLKIKLKA